MGWASWCLFGLVCGCLVDCLVWCFKLTVGLVLCLFLWVGFGVCATEGLIVVVF